MLGPVLDPDQAASLVAAWKDWAVWSQDRLGSDLARLAAVGEDPDRLVQVRLDATGLPGQVRIADAAVTDPVVVERALGAAFDAAWAQLAPAVRRRWQSGSAGSGAAVWAAVVDAGLANRSAVRAALGVEPWQQLVVIASQTRLNALKPRPSTPVEYLYLRVNADRSVLVEVPQPETAAERPDQGAGLVSALMANGLRRMGTDLDWRSLALAADCLVGEAGPMAAYAAALGRPVLLIDDQPDLLAAVTGPHVARLPRRADPDARINEAIEHHQGLTVDPGPAAGPMLTAWARWRPHLPARSAGPVALPVGAPVGRCAPLTAWRAVLRLDSRGRALTWQRFPLGSDRHQGSEVCAVDIAQRDPDLRDLDTTMVIMDHQRITPTDLVPERAVAALESGFFARAASIRTGERETHLVCGDGSRYRLRGPWPVLEILPAVWIQAQGLFGHLDLVDRGRRVTVEITRLRPADYTPAAALPVPGPQPPWQARPGSRELTAALEALAVPVPAGADEVALAGALWRTAARRLLTDPDCAERLDALIDAHRPWSWDLTRIVRLETRLAAAWTRRLDPIVPHTHQPDLDPRAAIADLLDFGHDLLETQPWPWQAKPHFIDHTAGRIGVYERWLDAKDAIQHACDDLTARGHWHDLVPTDDAPPPPPDIEAADEAAARALIAAVLDQCGPCRFAWRRRLDGPAALARALDLAAWARASDGRTLAAQAAAAAVPGDQPILTALGSDTATRHAAVTGWNERQRDRAIDLIAGPVYLSRWIFGAQDRPGPPPAARRPQPALARPGAARPTSGGDDVAAALDALNTPHPGTEADLEAAGRLYLTATWLLADLLDQTDQVDRPGRWQALIATADPGAEALPAWVHLIIARCARLATDTNRDRTGAVAATDPDSHDPVEAHARLAAGAIDAAGALLLWRALPDQDARTTTAALRRTARQLDGLATDLESAYRHRAVPCRASSGHQITLFDRAGGTAAPGERLFAAAAADCDRCCADHLTAAAAPPALAVLLGRAAGLLGHDRVRALAADAVPSWNADPNDRNQVATATAAADPPSRARLAAALTDAIRRTSTGQPA